MAWRPNIYYAAPIQSSDEESKRIARVTIEMLKRHGNVKTEHIGFDNLFDWENANVANGVNICNRDLGWLNESKVVIMDISRGSTGVGFEAGHNFGVVNHPTLAVFKEGSGTRMITQLRHPKLQMRSYKDEAELENVIEGFFANYAPSHRLHRRFGMTCAIDGAGKGAVYDAVKEWSAENGIPTFDSVEYWKHHNHIPSLDEVNDLVPGVGCLLVAEPTYAWIGKVIREEIIKKDAKRPYTALSTAHAYALDRDTLYKRMVLDALESGIVVFSDRGVVTSLVYQPVQAEMYDGYSREYFTGVVLGLPGNQQQLDNMPGTLILPQVDADLAMDRIEQRTDKQDNVRFENRPFQREIAKVYGGEQLRGFYEGHGTKVVYLTQGATREDTKAKARAIWEQNITS